MTANTGLGFTKALDEQKKKIDALGMKCATMVEKAKIKLEKIAVKREEALRELANAIEMTSDKRREFENTKRECINASSMLITIIAHGHIKLLNKKKKKKNDDPFCESKNSSPEEMMKISITTA